MISLNNVRKDEFIGLHVNIVDATNPSLVGIKGRVIDETKNTFVINNKKQIRLIKDQVVIETKINDKLLRIDGKQLSKRPEDRIKER